jgi:type IV secretory pathway VirB6-like protein
MGIVSFPSIIPPQQRSIFYVFFLLFLFASLTLIPDMANASTAVGTCTSQINATQAQGASGGIITSVMKIISEVLEQTSETLFKHIIGHQYYTTALTATVLLTVIVYGVMVLFGLADLKPGEVITRLFKLGMVLWISSPAGWTLITELVMKFFLGGMTDLVNLFLLGAVQTSALGNGGTSGGLTFDAQAMSEPLSILGFPLAQLFGAKFGTTILGLLGLSFAELNGNAFFMLLVMIWAGWNLLLALFHAIFVYVKSIVGLWFLIALSPIFIICTLYQTSRSLFQGWLNMMINFALQPVLLFGFFAFFLVMVSASMANIMSTQWCIETVDSWIFGLDINTWRPRSGPGWCAPYGTEWLVTGADKTCQGYGRAQFPIQVLDVLFFLIAAYLGLQYAIFVPQLTTALSRSGIALGAGLDDMRQFFAANGMTPEAYYTRGLKAVGVALVTAGGGAVAMGSRVATRQNAANNVKKAAGGLVNDENLLKNKTFLKDGTTRILNKLTGNYSFLSGDGKKINEEDFDKRAEDQGFKDTFHKHKEYTHLKDGSYRTRDKRTGSFGFFDASGKKMDAQKWNMHHAMDSQS